MIENILALLKEKHGQKLNLDDGEVFHLFLKDAMIEVYLDQDEKTIKIEVAAFDEGKSKVYFEDKTLDEVMGD